MIENEFFLELIKYGGGIGILIAMIFFLKQLGIFIRQTKSRNNNGDIEKRLKKIEENDLGDLEYIRERLDLLQRDFNDFKGKVEVRLAKIEAKLNGRKD